MANSTEMNSLQQSGAQSNGLDVHELHALLYREIGTCAVAIALFGEEEELALEAADEAAPTYHAAPISRAA